MVPGKIARVAAYVVLLLTIAVAAPAQQTAEKTAQQSSQRRKEAAKNGQFLRVVRDKDKTPLAMETAIVRFGPLDQGQKGPTVDLVAAVHVADRSYYRRLNREFAGYEAVLYELVAPPGTKVPQPAVGTRGDGAAGSRGHGTAASPISFLQNGIKDLLELEFQLNEIDYSRKNMVHADMSPEQFSQSMRDRGESVFAIFLRMMGYAMAKQQGGDTPSDGQLLLALLSRDRALVLKRLMAEEFENMEGSLMAIEGPKGSTLIGERNKVALKVLREQLSAGKRKIAIFYGAGHMSDMQRRLREEFQLVPVGTRWLTAWDMKAKRDPPPKTQPPKTQGGGKPAG